MSYARGDMSGVIKGLGGLLKTATGSTKKAEEYSRLTRTSSADAISWSGCKDSQTSADTVEAGQATGAMSEYCSVLNWVLVWMLIGWIGYAFIEVLTKNPQQSYQQLLVSIREVLRNKYSQKPQLSSSHPMVRFPYFQHLFTLTYLIVFQDTNVLFIA